MDAELTATEDTGRVKKLSEKVAERIVADIVDQGWPVGRNLGTEKDLLQKYGVARATFREAIRQVERNGAASMRRGAGGGLIVGEPPRAAAIRAMMTFFELTHVSFADQHETREVLEVTVARLAAERADRAQVDRLRGLVIELRGVTDFAASVMGNMAMRVAVADATGNTALSLFIEALNGVQRETVRVLRSNREIILDDMTQSVDFKHNLIEAIAARQVDRAERLVHGDMHRRLLAMTSAVARPPSPDTTVNYAGLPARWEGETGQGKLADQIVAHMVADIARLGWKQGHNLGREGDLQQQYGVSRAILREAIRQLELYGIARMRTGIQGGLVIGVVDPGYTVDLVVTYLRSTPLDVKHLWEVQSSLQVFAVGRLAQIGTPEDYTALREAMADVLSSSPENYLDRANIVHRTIADRTENRALSLFMRVLIQSATPLCPPVGQDNLPYLISMHDQIVAAIGEQDVKRAMALTSELFGRARVWLTGKRHGSRT